MPKRLLILAGAALLGLYVASAYWTLNRFEAALDARDDRAIDRMTDWAGVREGFRADMRVAMRTAMGEEEGSDAFSQGLMGIFTGLAVEAAVELHATPAGLRSLLQDGWESFLAPQPAPRGETGFRGTVTWAFFSGPASFRVKVAPSDPETEPVTLLFRFEDFSWRLVRVYLPVT
jgi:hypothetical protein